MPNRKIKEIIPIGAYVPESVKMDAFLQTDSPYAVNSASIIYAGFLAANRKGPLPDLSDDAKPDAKPKKGDAPATPSGGGDRLQDFFQKKVEGFDEHFQAERDHYTALVIEFVSVYQKKIIKPANKKGLLQMFRLPVACAASLKYLELIAGRVPQDKLIKTDDAVSTWASYHITASSTPTLCKKFLEEAPDAALRILGEDAVRAIDSSDPEDATHRIPGIVLAHVFCYLTASGYPFGNWYQGTKAINDAPTTFRAAWITFYTKYLELKSEMKETSKLSTVDQSVAYAAKQITGQTVAQEHTERTIREKVMQKAVSEAIASITDDAVKKYADALVNRAMSDVAY